MVGGILFWNLFILRLVRFTDSFILNKIFAILQTFLILQELSELHDGRTSRSIRQFTPSDLYFTAAGDNDIRIG